MQNQKNSLLVISLLASCCLIVLWPIRETIALRSLLLAIGGFASVFCVYYAVRNNIGYKLIPLAVLIAIFPWVLIHYLYFSLNQSLELREIQGIWLRIFLSVILGSGCAVAIIANRVYWKFFSISIFSLVAINLIGYLYFSANSNHFLTINEYSGKLFLKIVTVFFGTMAGCVSLFIIIKSRALWGLFIGIVGLSAVMISAVLSNSKNAILGVFFLFTLLLLHFIFYKATKIKVLGAVLLALLLVMAFTFHKSSAYKGWDSLIVDIAVAVDIDKNNQWQKPDGQVLLPKNSLGEYPAANTYYRFSWAMVGLRLIKEYPFGYGSVNESFKYLQKHAGIDNENYGQTHSGWVDFGLGFGFPALFIVFTTLVLTILFGFQSFNGFDILGVIFSATILAIGFIAEISWKEYMEATFFFISFASSLVAFNRISRGFS